MAGTSRAKLVLCLLLWLETLSTSLATSKLEMNLYAPVNPVNHDGFMSIYCQIWNLQDNHKVTISRQLQGSVQTEMLSWGKSVLGEAGDRVMLALRTLNDGSTVYFLSILDITRLDEGDYICKVRDQSDEEEVVGVSSVYVEVNYFPDEPSPICSPGDNMVVNEGQEMLFNCSSMVGKPRVTFRWRRTGTRNFQSLAVDNVQADDSYSILRFIPSAKDNGVIFMCEISSPAFPEITGRGCHVGPITVIPDDDNRLFVPVPTTSQSEDHETDGDTPSVFITTQRSIVNCQNSCPKFNSQVYYWILATVVFSIVALVFIVTGLWLLVRYNRLARASNSTAQQTRVCDDGEETYEQLEYRSDRKVYMALDKSWVPSHGNQVELQTHYNITPLNHVPLQYHHS